MSAWGGWELEGRTKYDIEERLPMLPRLSFGVGWVDGARERG
jgi:hypothetical protein